MFANYLKVAIRCLLRQRLYTTISVVGLSVGMAGCILIAAFIYHEISFENMHDNGGRIYRAVWHTKWGDTERVVASVAAPLAGALKDRCPEVEQVARLRRVDDVAMRVDQHVFSAGSMLLADAAILDIFTLPLLQGSPHTALSDPFSLLISKHVAETYFGDENPIGHAVRLAGQWDFQITGILQDIPSNTKMRYDLIGSYSSLEASGETVNDWSMVWKDHVYLLLRDGARASEVSAMMPGVIRDYAGDAIADERQYSLQPLEEIQLYHGKVVNELPPRGNLTLIYVSTSIALLVLLVGCVNFINLSTARAGRRFREVGLRKVLGAQPAHLARQFLVESLLVSSAAAFLGVVLYELGKPLLALFTGRDMGLGMSQWPALILLLAGLTVIVGLMIGCYPALILSRFAPVVSLRGGLTSGKGKAIARRALVVGQFAVAIALIALTGLIYKQVTFCGTRETGFERDNVFVMQIDDRDSERASAKCTLLKNELLREGVVTKAAMSYACPGEERVWIEEFGDAEHPENEPKPLHVIPVDYDYLEFYGLSLKEGRQFSEEYSEDNGETIVITESAAKAMGLDQPVGATLSNETGHFKVVGLVSDFSALPAFYKDFPPILKVETDAYSRVAVRLQPGNLATQTEALESAWQKVLPDEPFSLVPLEDLIRSVYQDQAQMASMGAVFAILAIFVACLGVLGLASFAVERRVKEIGVRKVLGASIPRLIWMFGKETLVLVIVSVLVAIPVVQYLGSVWLQEFPHRVAVGFDTIALPSCLVLLAAVLTNSVLALRAARANPVESLRYE